MAEAGVIFDWVNLPPDAETTQLWNCLHDGDLLRIDSDRLNRTIRLEIDVPYLREFHEWPDALTFCLTMRNVRSARVNTNIMWPGDASVPPGISREEQSRLLAEFYSKWREESVSWSEFESQLNLHTVDVEISNAVLARGLDGQVALKLGVLVDGGSYREILVRADSLDVSRSDDLPLTIEEFLTLGEAYWQAFSERRL